ncbi:MAG TPA: carbamoyl-phosphate synthase large subunit [Fimbriimonadales bacterium]|nr:carbamoyl-phosphate synthase large subunit [Fimbriimonadales bacterium]
MKKVMVIGSGPIVIGQAAEFDYAGTQACRALKEEGIEVVLINSNPATIMTDLEIADRVYIEPLEVDFCERVIAQERPDGLLATLGGQTGLNLATQLAEKGILEKYEVRLLGTPLEAIRKAEDREWFRELMREIREPVPESWIVTSEEELSKTAEIAPYPCIVRPAYTLGGTGGGVAHDREELLQIGKIGLSLSLRRQILVERSLLGWKEIEYEVIRDSADNCITICNMENIDPMGIHTGDSIVVAPSQTLSDIEYQILRSASLRIIRALGVEGGCNIQFAVNPKSFDYYVIEVNPRVSRSSALASKATGFPIARVSAKIAIGKTLDQIENAVTKTTKAAFEPALDYCVVKIPRFPFDKFTAGNRTLTTQMKSTGEVMAIDHTFEDALLKAVRGLEIGRDSLEYEKFTNFSDAELENEIRHPTDERLWALAEAFRRNWDVVRVHELSRIDPWFLNRIQSLVKNPKRPQPQSYKMVDTCAGEFESKTPYFYSTSDIEDDVLEIDSKPAVLVLGSGPIRIGQGIEFDYSCVHCAWELHEMGYRAVILNNNPETVSTDFDTADALYFDPVTTDDALRIIRRENAAGVMLQFGGQTAINLAESLHALGIRIFGTTAEAIRTAEDRDLFEKLLRKLGIPKPPGRGVVSVEEAIEVAEEIGYPVLVRPSFVLGGRAMRIVWTEEELREYVSAATQVSTRAPILVDRYVRGVEAEVDVISDGEDTLVPGIMEHIERAGVHSGDSMAVYPPITLSVEHQRRIIEIACSIAKELNVKGLMNIQFVIHDGEVLVLEVNPRASRTVPYLSKVTDLPMVKIATRCAMGETLKAQGYASGIWDPESRTVLDWLSHPPTRYPNPGLFAVKAPVFSFQKLTQVEPTLGPEMKSTGEVLGIDHEYPCALLKAMMAAGIRFPETGLALITVRDSDKEEAVEIARELHELGFDIAATRGTHDYLIKKGVQAKSVAKISEDENNLLRWVQKGKVALLINTPSDNPVTEQEALQIRRACVETGIPCITSLDTARALLLALRTRKDSSRISCKAIHEYYIANAKRSAAVVT